MDCEGGVAARQSSQMRVLPRGGCWPPGWWLPGSGSSELAKSRRVESEFLVQPCFFHPTSSSSVVPPDGESFWAWAATKKKMSGLALGQKPRAALPSWGQSAQVPRQTAPPLVGDTTADTGPLDRLKMDRPGYQVGARNTNMKEEEAVTPQTRDDPRTVPGRRTTLQCSGSAQPSRWADQTPQGQMSGGRASRANQRRRKCNEKTAVWPACHQGAGLQVFHRG